MKHGFAGSQLKFSTVLYFENFFSLASSLAGFVLRFWKTVFLDTLTHMRKIKSHYNISFLLMNGFEEKTAIIYTFTLEISLLRRHVFCSIGKYKFFISILEDFRWTLRVNRGRKLKMVGASCSNQKFVLFRNFQYFFFIWVLEFLKCHCTKWTISNSLINYRRPEREEF